MTANDRIDALERELKALKAFVDLMYFGRCSCEPSSVHTDRYSYR